MLADKFLVFGSQLFIVFGKDPQLVREFLYRRPLALFGFQTLEQSLNFSKRFILRDFVWVDIGKVFLDLSLVIDYAAHLQLLVDGRVGRVKVRLRVGNSDLFAERSIIFGVDLCRLPLTSLSLPLTFSLTVLLKPSFDLLVVVTCKLHDVLEGFIQILLDFFALLSSLNHQVVYPVFKVHVYSAHVFVQFGQASF